MCRRWCSPHSVSYTHLDVDKRQEKTGSPRGKEILDNFGEYLPKFKKVLPHDYDTVSYTHLLLDRQL